MFLRIPPLESHFGVAGNFSACNTQREWIFSEFEIQMSLNFEQSIVV